MKFTVLFLSVLLSVPAFAGSYGFTNETTCTGNLADAPISLAVKWEHVIEDAGNFPPFLIHQKQGALVTTLFNGQQTVSVVTFEEQGGTTRCEWWSSASTLLHLKETVVKLEFASSWNHSGCGHFPSGTFISDVQKPNSVSKLNCQ